ncbi:TcpD family membrane protein [Listeria monocytogenes]
MNHFVLAAAPSLGSATNYIQTEGGNALTIILIIFAVIFLAKQQIGKMVFFLGVAGLVFFVIGNPDSLMNGIKSIWDFIF